MYIDVFEMFPKMLRSAATNLVNEDYMKPLTELEGAYYSLPRKEDYKKFSKKNKIASIGDIFYRPSLDAVSRDSDLE